MDWEGEYTGDMVYHTHSRVVATDYSWAYQAHFARSLHVGNAKWGGVNGAEWPPHEAAGSAGKHTQEGARTLEPQRQVGETEAEGETEVEGETGAEGTELQGVAGLAGECLRKE